MDYKFKLLKMHCAACALALQEHLNNSIEGVSCEINYVTKVIKLHIETDNPAETLTTVKTSISKFDSMIEIVDFIDEADIEEKEKWERKLLILRLSIAAIFMVGIYFIPIFWLKVTLFALDYLFVSYKVLWGAIKNIRHGKIFDEKFLMSIASIGAFVVLEFIEAISVMWLYEIGSVLEDVAVNRSRKSASELLKIKQPYANLVSGDEETKVALDEVSVGDIIRIKPGERVPLDSKIIEGTSYLDMSALTGETKELIVQKGDKILSGAINGASVLLVRVEKLESESTISRIIDMVEKASEGKAKTEKFITKFSKYYTPVVIALAFVIMFIPPIFSGYADFVSYAYKALCFLVVSCPCALVISVPLTYFASFGAFARSGILVKGANYIDLLAKTDTVIFDKTGTLTKGDFEITEIVAFGDHTEDEILEIAAYAENFSNHRIAKSVTKAYNERIKKDINNAWIDGYTEIAGKGIKASIFMQDVLVGSNKLLEENEISVYEVSSSGTTLYIAIAGEFAGYIVIEDEIKPDSIDATKNLRKLGVTNLSLCTGDAENVAAAVSAKVGLNSYYAGMLPENKAEVVNKLVGSGKTVVFVGDGINDAPPLASASVGVAMGGLGSDVAVETSDVVLMTDEPSKLSKAIKKARKTRKIVLENIIGSIGIKIAILGLVSFGFAGMWLAVVADVGVNLLAVINSLRTMLKS